MRQILSVLGLLGVIGALGWALYAPRDQQRANKGKKAPAEVSNDEIRRVHAMWTTSAISQGETGMTRPALQPHDNESSAPAATGLEPAANSAPIPSTSYESPPEPDTPSPPTKDEAEWRLFDFWDREPANAAWSQQIAQRVGQALVEAGLPADRLQEVDCRQTLCRLELAFEHRSEAGRLYHARPKELDLFLSSNDRHFIVFLGRPGQRLQQIYSPGLDDTEP